MVKDANTLDDLDILTIRWYWWEWLLEWLIHQMVILDGDDDSISLTKFDKANFLI